MRKFLALGLFILVLGLALYLHVRSTRTRAEQASATQMSAVTSPTISTSQSDNSTAATRKIAQASTSNLPSAEKTEFLKRFPGEWTFHETPDGEVRSIMGGTFPEAAKDAETAFQFLKSIAPLLGAHPEQLRLSMFQPEGSSRGRSFRVEQVVDGIQVYQGGATLIGNKKTTDGFMVNSTIRSISFDGSKPLVTALQAEESLLKHYGLEAGDAGLTNPDPVLFEIKPGQAELAWVFSADLKGQLTGTHEVVVSAKTGVVLYAESRSLN